MDEGELYVVVEEERSRREKEREAVGFSDMSVS